MKDNPRRPPREVIPPRDEVERELAFHIEMRTRDLVARGMDPETARRDAIARFGQQLLRFRRCVWQSPRMRRNNELRAGRFCGPQANPSMHRTCYGWLRQPPPAGDLKR